MLPEYCLQSVFCTWKHTAAEFTIDLCCKSLGNHLQAWNSSTTLKQMFHIYFIVSIRDFQKVKLQNYVNYETLLFMEILTWSAELNSGMVFFAT